MRLPWTSIVLLVVSSPAWAVDPPPVPLTRPEMKQLLEESKKYEPRLRTPAPTPEELAETKRLANAFGSREGEHARISYPAS